MKHALLIAGLRTWWRKAVNAPFLAFRLEHIEAARLALGVAATLAMVVLTIHVVVRRLAENTMGTLAWFVPLFVPIAFGAHDLYHWSHAEEVSHDPLLLGKSGYLNLPFFLIRAGLYLGSWSLLAWWFLRHPSYRFQRKAFAITLAGLLPLGFGLDILFAHAFFTFENRGATLGVEVPVVGGSVPVEEFAFYLLGFLTMLLLYIWCDEYWLGAYNVPDYRAEAAEEAGGPRECDLERGIDRHCTFM